MREPAAQAVWIDAASRELVVDGQRTALTGRELEVLRYLMERGGEAVKRGDLLDDLWGTGYEGGSNVIDVVVLSLRKKLGVRASDTAPNHVAKNFGDSSGIKSVIRYTACDMTF